MTTTTIRKFTADRGRRFCWLPRKPSRSWRRSGILYTPGALGENITTVGVDRTQWRAGQRWRVGQSILELTKPRAPCETLSVYGAGIQTAVYDSQVKAGDPSSPRWALAGFYASVLQPGIVRPGDPVVLLDQMV